MLEVLGYNDKGLFAIQSHIINGKKYLYYETYGNENLAREKQEELVDSGYYAQVIPQEVQNFWTKQYHTDYEVYVYTPTKKDTK